MLSRQRVDILPNDEDLRWLLEHADHELQAAKLPEDPVRLVAFFRKRHSATRSRMLAELRKLRQRAATKFSNAQRMFFTSRALQQATDQWLAKYKANRFPPHIHVVDLCCGLGGDAIALAQRGPLTAIDKDAAIAHMAAANLHVLGLDAVAHVRCMDVRQVDLSQFDAWHLDPDRRPTGSRRSAPEYGEPALGEFVQFRQRAPQGAVKLAPAANVPELFAEGVELEWLGHSRQCQQLVAWFGSLARHPGKRVATWLWHKGASEQQVATLVDEAVEPATVADSLARYLYEPQPSVLAAKLEDVLAARYGLKRVARGIAYFVSEMRIENEPLLTGFEILESLPPRVNTLRRHIAALDGRVLEVKKRGVRADPHQWHRQLATKGTVPLSVILVTMRKSTRAILGRRLRQGAASQ